MSLARFVAPTILLTNELPFSSVKMNPSMSAVYETEQKVMPAKIRHFISLFTEKRRR